MSEVAKICPSLKLRVFADDSTALVKGRYKKCRGNGKKVMKKLKEGVEKKGLELSVSENGKERKSKMAASCGFLENEESQFSTEGVTLADSVETLEVDLRTTVKRLGAKEKTRRKKCLLRFSVMKNNKAFQKNCMKVGVKKLLRAGMMPARTWRAHAVGMSPTERLKLRDRWQRQQAKRAQLCFPCSWRHMALKLKKSFPPWLLKSGQKEFRQENGITS